MDLLVQILAIHGDSECHQGKRAVLRRWERWRSAQSASANQCQGQNTRHSGDAVEGSILSRFARPLRDFLMN